MALVQNLLEGRPNPQASQMAQCEA